MLCLQSIVNSPVSSNCYVLYDKENDKDCIIVDPGSKEDTNVIEYIIQNNLNPRYIILTHEHFDHCWGVNELVGKFHIPIICSALCAEAIKSEKRNCSVFYDNKERFTIDSETISVESLKFKLLFGNTTILFYSTPGHTEASICFACQQFLFSGDTLIKDVRTVTKLPTGSESRLRESMDLLNDLKGEGKIVNPGHGEMFHLDKYDLNKMINDLQKPLKMKHHICDILNTKTALSKCRNQ